VMGRNVPLPPHWLSFEEALVFLRDYALPRSNVCSISIAAQSRVRAAPASMLRQHLFSPAYLRAWVRALHADPREV